MVEREIRGSPGLRRRRRRLRGLGWLIATTLVVGLAPPIRAADSPDADQGSEASEESTGKGDFSWESEEKLFEVEEEDEDATDERGDEVDRARRRRDLRLSELSKSEARGLGFEFGDEREASRQTTAVLLASTVGAFVHGVGHWYVDDPRTAAFLAGTEGVGLTLAGAGVATWYLEGETPAGAAVATTTFHVGMGLFGLSYVLDVVGAVRGTNVQLPARRRLRGVRIDTGYRYLGVRGYPLNHHFEGAVEFDFGRIFGRASTDQEFGLDASSYGGEIGARWWRGARLWTFAYTTGSVEFFDFRETGAFDRWRGDLRLGLSLDLGFVSPHLERVAVGLEGGYGRSWYNLESPGAGGRPIATGFIPLEIYSHFHLSERIHTRASYERAPGRRLQATRRLGGIGSVELRYDSTELLDLKLGAEFGSGVGITGGLVFHLL